MGNTIEKEGLVKFFENNADIPYPGKCNIELTKDLVWFLKGKVKGRDSESAKTEYLSYRNIYLGKEVILPKGRRGRVIAIFIEEVKSTKCHTRLQSTFRPGGLYNLEYSEPIDWVWKARVRIPGSSTTERHCIKDINPIH